jgi:ferrous iron transport protein B
MWHRAEQYLKKIGGIILIASIIIWALGYFPRSTEETRRIGSEISVMMSEADQALKEGNLAHFEALGQQIKEAELQQEYERQRGSLIGKIGNFVQPALNPLGFDWKMSVAILSGIAAKEIVVGTLGVLYQSDAQDEAALTASLVTKLQEQEYQEGPKAGQKVFNPLVALSFMLFVLIYFPCIAVIATIRKESGSWKWAAFTVFYTTGIAWIVAFLVFQVGNLMYNL